MATDNPFAFLLAKPRASLDRAFYAKAQKFEDLDDEMWRYLLAQIPSGRGSYEARTRRMLHGLSPQLRTYFLLRSLDGDWGSDGMEGALDKEDCQDWLRDTVAAFRTLGAEKHADVLLKAAALAALAERTKSGEERDVLYPQFKRLDEEWSGLEHVEDFFGVIFQEIKRDAGPYLHPTQL